MNAKDCEGMRGNLKGFKRFDRPWNGKKYGIMSYIEIVAGNFSYETF